MKTLITRLAVVGSLLAAARVDTQPLRAQTTRDSAIAKAATTVKAVIDTIAIQPAPNLAQFCSSGFGGYGYMRNGACLSFPRLLRRAQVADSLLVAALALPVVRPKPDTVTIHTKPDTVRIVRVDTVVVAPTPAPTPSPTPVAVASVTTSVSPLTLLPGEHAQASVVVKDSNGTPLSGRAATWSSSAPSVASVSSAGVVTAIAPGTSAIRATVDTKSSFRTVTVNAAPTPVPVPTPVPTPTPAPVDTTHAASAVELPRVFLSTTPADMPSPGPTIQVTDGATLQTAIDTAPAGSRIVMACGQTFSGNLALRPKAGASASKWITVASNCPTPPEGTRASRTGSFARIIAPNLNPAIHTEGQAAFYHLVGLEVSADSAQTSRQELVLLGLGEYPDTSLSVMAHDIVIDRSYVHGTPNSDLTACIRTNAVRLAVIESVVSECHSGARDAGAIGMWQGSVVKISNNTLEGAAENVQIGGSGGTSVKGFVSTDIEVTHNHIVKPMSWKGGPWNVKNLFEIKAGRRILIEGNVLENSWPYGQQGETFMLWSATSGCTYCITEHLTIRNNVLKNVSRAFSLNERYDGTTQGLRNVAITNNVAIGVASPAVGGTGHLFQIVGIIPTLSIEHNTAFTPSNSSFLWNASTILAPNQIIQNNLTGGGQYQLFGSGGQGLAAWTPVAGPGSAFLGNVVVGAVNVIPGNTFPGSFNDVGLVGGGSVATSVTATLDQLALSAASTFKGKATDGKDPGADIAAVKAATAGVVAPAAVSAKRIPVRKP
jgi:hypothetical protein